VNIEIRKIPPNNNKFVHPSWNLKERIRSRQGLLRQGRRFFEDTYIEGTVYLAFEENDIRGFGIIHKDYLAILGVDPDSQGHGVGKRIMEEVLEDVDQLRCHTRKSNRGAIKFYKDLGFESERIHKNYYDNNEDAAIMVFKSD
jgi:ribosomal-protein-alanine N-acetyltransferase